MIQAMGGIMDLTGDPDGPPHKVGVAYADIMTGLYAVIAIQAALTHRARTGEGQAIDMAPARHAGRRARQPGDELTTLPRASRRGAWATPTPTSCPTRNSR
ncbi:MAG: CoA transferase [Bauldia sp.]